MAKGKWVKCDTCKGNGKIKRNAAGKIVDFFTLPLSLFRSSTCHRCKGKGSVFLPAGSFYV